MQTKKYVLISGSGALIAALASSLSDEPTPRAVSTCNEKLFDTEAAREQTEKAAQKRARKALKLSRGI